MSTKKEKVAEKKKQLKELSLAFSQEHLNSEYDEVIEKLIDKMGRKREVPFLTGRMDIWAAAVVHSLGTINFLFDKSFEPYVAVSDICEFFNTKQSTSVQKSKVIRDMFKMSYYDNEFSTASMSESSPFNSMSMMNGFLLSNDLVKDKVVEWEAEVAKILGIDELDPSKDYHDSDIFRFLAVTPERLETFYTYLQDNLSFPFDAMYEEENGPTSVLQMDVTCVQLNQDIKIDDIYAILIDVKIDEGVVTLPLGSMTVSSKNQNADLIELYNHWFWVYHS
ncbi:DUF6398 domain-containing protein [Aureibacillus halotolerans]|nr:DUF6398 domain-containing protein [Aureibacillus halotolerans]